MIMAKNVDATPIMEHELSLIQQDVNSIVHHLKQKKESQAFTFHIYTGTEYQSVVSVNKKHISMIRIDHENKSLLIFFSGDEGLEIQWRSKKEPNYIGKDGGEYWAIPFLDWFDDEWTISDISMAALND